MAALQDFIKKNASGNVAGKIGKGFIAFDLANLVAGESKLKSLWQLFKDIILLKPVMASAFAGLFLGMGRSIRSLVHDTGSLEAALKKLSQIQGLQKIFAPLVGGAAAAKLKVAELVNFAASRNVSLGDAGEAARSLEIMTRGGFAGAQALDTVLDAAKATGNGFRDTADAVGQFHDTLRSGESITTAVEQLRQMGIVSNDGAESLLQLQKNGASVGQIFTTLTASLEQFHGGAKAAADDIDSVNAAYETAAANLQEKFASPFVESDIENTKNMTAAMNGFAPAVARVSSVFAILFNAFSTTKTATAKFAGESEVARKVIEGFVYVLTGLVTVAGLIGAISLGTWFIGVGIAAATAASTAANAAIAFAAVAGAVGVFVTLAAVAVGVGLQLKASFERQVKAMDDAKRATEEVNAAMEKQIKNARTLADRQDAIAKSLDNVTAAQKALNEARKTGNKDAIAEAEGSLALAEKRARHAQRITGLAPTDAAQQADRDRVNRDREQKEERFQAELSAAKPARQAELLAQHSKEAEERARRGAIGEQARLKFTEKSIIATEKVMVAEKRLEIARAAAEAAKTAMDKAQEGAQDFNAAEERQAIVAAMAEQKKATLELTDAQLALNNARAGQATVGSNAPLGTSVQLEAAQRAMLASTDPERARKAASIGLLAERARQNEAMRAENEMIALRDKAAAKALAREVLLNRLEAQRELDLQNAEVKRDEKTRQRIEDFSVFADKYQQLLNAGFTETEAEKAAKQFTNNAISLNTPSTGAVGQVADSLARIGGGGGVAGPRGDPLLTVAERQAQLQSDAVGYLKQIAEAGKKGVL